MADSPVTIKLQSYAIHGEVTMNWKTPVADDATSDMNAIFHTSPPC